MRVILTSHGSTGDIYPVIALAVAFQRAGHQVRFATTQHYRADIEAAGVEFYPLCPSWQKADIAYWMGRLNQIRLPVFQLREIFVGARPYIREMIERMDAIMPETDLLVSSYLFPMNRGIADRHGVPFATIAFSPHLVPNAETPPEGLPSPRWIPRGPRRAWNRWLWKTGNAVVDFVINKSVGAALRETGLPKVHRFFSEPAERILVTVPGSIFRPQDAEIDPRFRYTGYCRWQSPEDPALDAEVNAFTGGRPVPVLTFGSMVYENAAAWMERFVRAWPRDRKIIVQRGWAEFPALDGTGHIKVIGKVSHDQLFRHASVVIHHGGAGTTASALHAGAPQIIVPHIGDQAFFGQEMERLGCGVRLAKHRWPEHLHQTIDRLLASAEPARRAAAIRDRLLAENGPLQAVKELESFVAEKKRSAAP